MVWVSVSRALLFVKQNYVLPTTHYSLAESRDISLFFSYHPARMSDQDAAALPGYDFIKTILELLVEDRDQLFVEGKVDELGVLITVRVSERDMGKLIGKSGQTIKSIRTLLRVVGGTANKRVNLKVLEPELQAAA